VKGPNDNVRASRLSDAVSIDHSTAATASEKTSAPPR
jgi:hypothetical protein